MPTIDDFSPVGQVLLRKQEMVAGQPAVSAGIETHKQRAGFFERLAGLATGRRSAQQPTRTVAQQSQANDQMARVTMQNNPGSLDPHVKGGALSPQRSPRVEYAEENEEVPEFPSFLRGGR